MWSGDIEIMEEDQGEDKPYDILILFGYQARNVDFIVHKTKAYLEEM